MPIDSRVRRGLGSPTGRGPCRARSARPGEPRRRRRRSSTERRVPRAAPPAEPGPAARRTRTPSTSCAAAPGTVSPQESRRTTPRPFGAADAGPDRHRVSRSPETPSGAGPGALHGWRLGDRRPASAGRLQQRGLHLRPGPAGPRRSPAASRPAIAPPVTGSATSSGHTSGSDCVRGPPGCGCARRGRRHQPRRRRPPRRPGPAGRAACRPPRSGSSSRPPAARRLRTPAVAMAARQSPAIGRSRPSRPGGRPAAPGPAAYGWPEHRCEPRHRAQHGRPLPAGRGADPVRDQGRHQSTATAPAGRRPSGRGRAGDTEPGPRIGPDDLPRRAGLGTQEAAANAGSATATGMGRRLVSQPAPYRQHEGHVGADRAALPRGAQQPQLRGAPARPPPPATRAAASGRPATTSCTASVTSRSAYASSAARRSSSSVAGANAPAAAGGRVEHGLAVADPAARHSGRAGNASRNSRTPFGLGDAALDLATQHLAQWDARADLVGELGGQRAPSWR